MPDMEKLEEALPEGMSVSKLTEVLKTAGYDLVPTEGGEMPEADEGAPAPFGAEPEGEGDEPEPKPEGNPFAKGGDDEEDDEPEKEYPKDSDGDRMQNLKKILKKKS